MRSGAELAADEIESRLEELRFSTPPMAVASTIHAIITKHLPSGDVGKLLDIAVRLHEYGNPRTTKGVEYATAVGDLVAFRAALTSVPASPPQVDACSWDETAGRCSRGTDGCPEKHASESTAPQVDTTLEEIAGKLRTESELLNADDVALSRNLERLADAISAHARKSQPKVPAVTPEIKTGFHTLQKCVFALRLRGDPMADDIWGAICTLSHIFNPAQNPAAESAAVPSMEELADALRALLLDTQHAEHSCKPFDDDCPVDKARAVLAKFDAAMTKE